MSRAIVTNESVPDKVVKIYGERSVTTWLIEECTRLPKAVVQMVKKFEVNRDNLEKLKHALEKNR